MKIDILSLFPGYFLSPFNESMLKHAQSRGLLTISHTNIRDFSQDKHKKVDDRPYGGGPGMVLMPEPISLALEQVRTAHSKVIYLSPQGQKLTSQKCQQLAQEQHLILLCGHYEGVDERILQQVDQEISVGDYVLTSGASAVILLVDALVRYIPGVLGHELSAQQDSFHHALLDHPHFTRPENFKGEPVPEVLLTGDHEKIAQWRLAASLKNTLQKRPDLYLDYANALSKKGGEGSEVHLCLPVTDYAKMAQFFWRIGHFTIEPLILGALTVTFIPVATFEKPPSGTIIGVDIKELEIINLIYKKLLKTDYLIEKTSSSVSFKDPSGYLWKISYKENRGDCKIYNELKTATDYSL